LEALANLIGEQNGVDAPSSIAAAMFMKNLGNASAKPIIFHVFGTGFFRFKRLIEGAGRQFQDRADAAHGVGGFAMDISRKINGLG
jgi:hypothetical protein